MKALDILNRLQDEQPMYFENEVTEAIAELEAQEIMIADYKKRIEELEDANTQMMRVCNPSAINIAIKATKLPPLKGC